MALLLGVDVELGTPLQSLLHLRVAVPGGAAPPRPTGGAAARSPAAAKRAAAKLLPPDSVPDVLVDATGARCDLFDGFGFEQITVLRSQRALGLVVHFVNGKTPEEKAVEEGTWAHQYHQARFTLLTVVYPPPATRKTAVISARVHPG